MGPQECVHALVRKQGPIATGFRCWGRCLPPVLKPRGRGVWVPAFAGTTRERFKPHTWLRDLAASFARGLLKKSRPEIRGRRECRAPDAPASACAKVESKSTRVSQVTPEKPGIPRAMVLTVSFVLSPVTGLLPPSLADHSESLTPASGRQDHTTSPSACALFVKSASASTASRLTFVTIAKRPSFGAG